MENPECKRGLRFLGGHPARNSYLFFSTRVAESLWTTAAVARADVDFIFQHNIHVVIGYGQLRHSGPAPYDELVDYRNYRRSSIGGEIKSHSIGFLRTEIFKLVRGYRQRSFEK